MSDVELTVLHAAAGLGVGGWLLAVAAGWSQRNDRERIVRLESAVEVLQKKLAYRDSPVRCD